MNTQNSKVHTQNEEDMKISENLSRIKHRIVVFSGKGGVGKTTVSVNLAFGFQQKGHKTGLLDADITGPNISKMLGLSGNIQVIDNKLIPLIRNELKVISIANIIENNQPVIWRGPLRSKLLNQFLGDVLWGELDFLVADLPPGTGDEILTMTQKMQPDMAIIVTTPQEVSLIDSARAINMAKKMNIKKIGLIENMSGLICPKCGENIEIFGSGGGKKQSEEMGIEFLGTLPLDLKTRKLADQGQPILLADAQAGISILFKQIVDKIMTVIMQ